MLHQVIGPFLRAQTMHLSPRRVLETRSAPWITLTRVTTRFLRSLTTCIHPNTCLNRLSRVVGSQVAGPTQDLFQKLNPLTDYIKIEERMGNMLGFLQLKLSLLVVTVVCMLNTRVTIKMFVVELLVSDTLIQLIRRLD